MPRRLSWVLACSGREEYSDETKKRNGTDKLTFACLSRPSVLRKRFLATARRRRSSHSGPRRVDLLGILQRLRVDFQPPACVIAARSISSSARFCAAPTRVE